MRSPRALLALFAALAAAGPACAAQLRVPDEQPVHFEAYASPQIAEPWAHHSFAPAMTEKPIAEIIATRLGLVEGSAELFRYRVEDAPSARTMLDGVVDGGGIKLKLTW